MAQTAVCDRHHSLDQQPCRWLRSSAWTALQGNELTMTQELIANMLGVRCEGVTEGALKLQKAGLILRSSRSTCPPSRQRSFLGSDGAATPMPDTGVARRCFRSAAASRARGVPMSSGASTTGASGQP
jgi:hypothetical protein